MRPKAKVLKTAFFVQLVVYRIKKHLPNVSFVQVDQLRIRTELHVHVSVPFSTFKSPLILVCV